MNKDRYTNVREIIQSVHDQSAPAIGTYSHASGMVPGTIVAREMRYGNSRGATGTGRTQKTIKVKPGKICE